jgi:hypothetical protein
MVSPSGSPYIQGGSNGNSALSESLFYSTAWRDHGSQTKRYVGGTKNGRIHKGPTVNLGDKALSARQGTRTYPVNEKARTGIHALSNSLNFMILADYSRERRTYCSQR